MAPPPLETAMYTDSRVTGLVLNSFENFRRRVSPPKDTLMICRKALSVNPGDGGLLLVSTNWGAVLQLPTHLVAAVEVKPTLRQKRRLKTQKRGKMSRDENMVEV